MKKVILLVSILQCLVCISLASPGGGNDDGAAGLLREALENMGKVTGYHAKADLALSKHQKSGRAGARIEGDFGVGRLAYTTVGFDGKRTQVIVIRQDVYTLSEGGGNWVKGVKQGSAELSLLVTGPVNPQYKLAEQGEVKIIGREEVDGTPTTHLVVQAASPVDVWVADDPQVGKVVRKIHLISTSDDGMDFDTTVIYSDFNKPIDVKAPTTSG